MNILNNDNVRQKDGSLVYCEHNRIGIRCISLWGDFTVYTCAKNLRGNPPLLAGWYKECEYICSSAPKGTKYISWTEMQKNESRLKMEEKERQENLEEAKRLRKKADYNIARAQRLEEENG